MMEGRHTDCPTIRVYLCGGDGRGWALDDDLDLTRRALEGVVSFTDLHHCDVVHAVWWEGLLQLDEPRLREKRVLCHIPAEPFRYLTLPKHRHAVQRVGHWVTRTGQASDQCCRVGLSHTLIPYTTNIETFHPLPDDHPDVVSLRQSLEIPDGSYLIGNFHRDSEGADVSQPKLVKGPDVFGQIVRALRERGCPVHVLLAGPRRHWLRQRLSRWGIPFTFMGQDLEGDDFDANILSRDQLNLLYHLLDLCLVTSRSEGGPQSIMEAAAAGCRIMSSRVGLAEDILEPICVYNSPAEAVDRIEQDIREQVLAEAVELHRDRILKRHHAEAVTPLFQDLYSRIHTVPPYEGDRRARVATWPVQRPFNALRRLVSRVRKRPFTAGLWHTFFSPPYGGGNQFMMALRKALIGMGVRVLENQLTSGIDAYILNSVHFDVDRFRRIRRRWRLNVVHRIDGPIHLIRGSDREKDELCFRLNQALASVTVIQSAWTYEKIVEMGYQPVNPVIIHNTVDPDLFHSTGRIPFETDQKVRLISTSWSDNPRKGGPFYKWMEDHLDWQRFEYTFVGRASERFDRIRHIPPVPSEQLAKILRQHDIFVTASENDPCSNALIEALACGLPALYLNDGGHPELVGYGGLPFSGKQDILSQLDRLVEDYEMFQNLIVVPSLDDVANRYLTLMREVAE